MPNPEHSTVRVLAVLSQKADRAALAGIFSHSNWKLDVCETLREARVRHRDGGTGVIICDSVLPDGAWQSLLDAVAAMEPQPRLILALPTPDCQVWAEVINLGGYDAIVKPFHKEEVVRIVSLAWLSWRDALQAIIPKPIPARVQHSSGAAAAAV